MKRLLVILVLLLSPFGMVRGASAMSGCGTRGIVWNGSAFGSAASCTSQTGNIQSIRTWVSCNGGGPQTGPWVSVANIRSVRYCAVGQSVSSYGYSIVGL